MKKDRVSNNVIRRLPMYLRKLDDLIFHGVDRISSGELGKQMGLTPSQIRQDFSCFGEFGQQGYGYRVTELREQVARILGMHNGFSVAIVGVGNLGHALLENFPFEEHGFKLTAGFDSSPEIFGRTISGIPVLDSAGLTSWLKNNPTDIIVLTVPRAIARSMAETVADCGVRGIWNFTNIELELDRPDVRVENIHFSDSLLTLGYFLAEQDNTDKTKQSGSSLEDKVNIKRIISYLLIFVFVLGFSSAAASTAGSSADPLISKSYIDGTYQNAVLSDPEAYLTSSMTVLGYKLGQTGNTAGKGVYIAQALAGGSISMSAGSSFILLSGSAKLSTCTGMVIDVTDGNALSVGAALKANHRYVAADNTTASAAVVTAASIAVYGDISISGGTAAFTDVPQDEWYYSYVSYAVQKGLINGRTTSTFAPDDNLTIAEAIKLASCIYQLYHSGSITLTNASPLWYKSYVDFAVQNGIVTKTYDDYTAKISRSEFVSIFYAALPSSEYAKINTVADNAIPDVKTSAAYSAQIYAFYRAGILTGSDSSGTFYPDTNIKRSEVATIVTRMFETSSRKSITLSQN